MHLGFANELCNLTNGGGLGSVIFDAHVDEAEVMEERQEEALVGVVIEALGGRGRGS